MTDDPGAPERIDAVYVMGCNVMAGTYEDGSVEVRLWESQPVNPRTAVEETRSWLEEVVDDE